ncbi:MAG: hypothetical protein V3U52_00465 [Thermoplasmata archaeon]
MESSATKYPEEVRASINLRSEARIGQREKPKLYLVGHPFAYTVTFTNLGTKEIPGYKDDWQLLVHITWGDGGTQILPHNMKDKLPPGRTVSVDGRTTVRSPGLFSIKVGYPFHKRWDDKEKNQQYLQHGEETVPVGTWIAVDESTYIQRRNFWLIVMSTVATVASILVVFLFG